MSIAATGRNGIRRMGALACLVAFGLGPAKFLPFVFALAADLEGSHTVRLGQNAEGETKLVLSHERGHRERADFSPAHNPRCAAHHHGAASQVVCLLAGCLGGEADHVACFASGGVSENAQTGPRALTTCPDSKQVLPSFASSAVKFSIPSSVAPVALVTATREAAAHHTLARHRCLRSTCLLI